MLVEWTGLGGKRDREYMLVVLDNIVPSTGDVLRKKLKLIYEQRLCNAMLGLLTN